MNADRGIRDWYRASRSGSRGEFLKDVQSLTCDSLIALLNQERSCGDKSRRLRSKDELESLSRSVCPDIESHKAKPFKEQTLQWLFVHRKYLSGPYESILFRELPTCYAGERVKGRADLLGFDHARGQPLLIELKDGEADDPLSGAILELLYHWAFHTSHIEQFHALLAEFGCEAKIQSRLLLIAPQPFYDKAKRRSRERHGEFERAIAWIDGLASSNLVTIERYSLDPDWQQQGVDFRMVKVS